MGEFYYNWFSFNLKLTSFKSWAFCCKVCNFCQDEMLQLHKIFSSICHISQDRYFIICHKLDFKIQRKCQNKSRKLSKAKLILKIPLIQKSFSRVDSHTCHCLFIWLTLKDRAWGIFTAFFFWLFRNIFRHPNNTDVTIFITHEHKFRNMFHTHIDFHAHGYKNRNPRLFPHFVVLLIPPMYGRHVEAACHSW